MMNRQRLMITSVFGGDLKELTNEQVKKIETTMTLFAVQEIQKFKEREIKGELKSFVKLLLRFNYDNVILYARSKVLNLAIRNAKLRAKTEGKKTYVVREGLIGYKTLSTLDVKHNKKVRVMKKEIDFIKMGEISSYAAYPKNK